MAKTGRSTPLFLEFLSLLLGVWLVAWQLLGDKNGWLALFNAWAWWLLTAAIPAGMAALWRRSKLLSLAWGMAVAALWLKEYRWTLPFGNIGHSVAQTRGNNIDVSPVHTEIQKSTKALSLLTLNLLNSKRDLTPFLALVQREFPDVLLLQECIPSHVTQLEEGLAHLYPHRLWLPAANYAMGFGIAARLPFALTGVWAYPGFEPFAARITLSPPDPSNLTAGPIESQVRQPSGTSSFVRHGHKFDIYCVQFISPTNEVLRMGPTALLRLRERQIESVLGEIEQRKHAALVAGDWNSTEGSDAYRRATDSLVDGWREAGNGPGWSWPRNLNPLGDRPALPMLRLDYMMHTGCRFAPKLALSQMQVIRNHLGSDHCPLLVELAME